MQGGDTVVAGLRQMWDVGNLRLAAKHSITAAGTGNRDCMDTAKEALSRSSRKSREIMYLQSEIIWS